MRRRGIEALFLCLLILFAAGARAQEGDMTLTALYGDQVTRVNASWPVTYNDRLFAQSSDTYSHALAQVSLGMAVSAFRIYYDRDLPLDHNIRSYLGQAGFTDLESTDYDQTPSLQTVATVIGHKKMEDEKGPYTLIVTAICGGGYQKEWLSNFTIGDRERHEGFNRAAHNVEGRILLYMVERGFTGRLKLWIAGYSRAAAISNLVGADMTDFGPFEEGGVFVYTFATPRNTRDIRSGRYPNIFNIVGKMDPIPHVPLAEWGYGRYGTNLYLPSLETDSDYTAKLSRASAIYEAITDVPLKSNPEVNHRIRRLLDYVGTLVESPEVYTKYVQERLKSIYDRHTLLGILGNLLGIVSDSHLLSPEKKEAERELGSFAISFAWEAAYAGGSIHRKWNPEISSEANLLGEHMPMVYIAWMFSTDSPEELFSSSQSYERYVISGDVALELSDEYNRVIQRMDAQGNITFPDLSEGELPEVQILMERRGQDSIAVFPEDRVQYLSAEVLSDGPVSFFTVDYDLRYVKVTPSDIYFGEGHKGDIFLASSMSSAPEIVQANEALIGEYGLTEEDDAVTLQSRDPWKDGGEYSHLLVDQLEKLNDLGMTWLTLLYVATGALLILLVAPAGVLIGHIVRKRRRNKQNLPRKTGGSEYDG